MKIRHGDTRESLELTSSIYGAAILGGAIGLIGAAMGLAFLVPVLMASGLLGLQGPSPILLLNPLIFLLVGLFALSSAKRVRATLRVYGQSEARFFHRLGLKRSHEIFDAQQTHHVVLHTDERISRSKNGTRRYRVSHLYLILRDGREVLIGINRSGGFGGSQPLLEQAAELSGWLRVPLERTGYGAPPGMGSPAPYVPGRAAGPPSWWSTTPQHGQQPPYEQGTRQPGDGRSNPDSFGGVR